MNILIGCEHFATVRDAFKMKGHNAVSCDFKPSVNTCKNNFSPMFFFCHSTKVRKPQ